MGKNKQENALDAKLRQVYVEHGIKSFLSVCSKMLSISDRPNFEKKKRSNGEVCEVVLDVLTENYLQKRGIKGKTFHSMILKDAEQKSDFRTELDFTLLTPGLCLSGECKSFVGDITVRDECTLVRGDLVADVGRQSILHGKYLRKYLMKYALDGKHMRAVPFGLFCFVFSNGSLRDTRTTEQKQTIPVLTVATLYAYYDRVLSRFTEEVYDYERAAIAFGRFERSEALHRQHRNFVGY